MTCAVQFASTEASLKAVIDSLHNGFHRPPPFPEFRVSRKHAAIIVAKRLGSRIAVAVLAIHAVGYVRDFPSRSEIVCRIGDQHSAITYQAPFFRDRNSAGVRGYPYRILRSDLPKRPGRLLHALPANNQLDDRQRGEYGEKHEQKSPPRHLDLEF